MSQQLHRRRVVITGMGAVSPLGLTMVETWHNLISGKSGLTSLHDGLFHQQLQQEQFEQELRQSQSLPCQVVAPVKDFVFNNSTSSTTSRFVQLALSAATEAVASAGLTHWWGSTEQSTATTTTNTSVSTEEYNTRQRRTGVSMGTGMSCVREITDAIHRQSNSKKLSPHFVPRVLGNSAAARIALHYNLRGPNCTSTAACAAGSHAIGDAVRMIQYSVVDIMLAGGSESCIDPLSLAGFTRLRALSTLYNDTPTLASRPFDRHRDGFVMGEGACVLVFEELNHALDRLRSTSTQQQVQLPPYLNEVVGYGSTCDAHHITAPDPNGRGAMEAMHQALYDAHMGMMQDTSTAHDYRVGYVNAHATSTPLGDDIEAKAIHQALVVNNIPPTGPPTSNLPPVLVSSTKGATGHLLGAAGALEAAIVAQTLLDQKVPVTRNLETVLDSDDARTTMNGLSFVQGEEAVSYASTYGGEELTMAMSNSFGFGGTNASLVFRRIRPSW